MQYAILIYDEEGVRPEPGTPEFDSMMKRYFSLSEEFQRRGILRAGEGLQGVETATTVRVRSGKVLTTDGPFADTKEQFGGFYLLDCEDLDEAIELASKIPSAEFGSVEIRPVMEFDEAAGSA